VKIFINTEKGMSNIEERDYELTKEDNGYYIQTEDKKITLKKIPFFKFIAREYTVFFIAFVLMILATTIIKPVAFIIYTLLAFLSFIYLLKKNKIESIKKVIGYFIILNATLSFLFMVMIKKNIYLVADINSAMLYGTIVYSLELYMMYFRYKYYNILNITENGNKTDWYLFYPKNNFKLLHLFK
jgi:hypothetical protein